MDGAVRERRTRAHEDAAVREQPPVGLERDPAQRHDDLRARQRGDLRNQMRVAADHFFTRRLVAWRRAAHDGRNEGIDQRQPVLPMLRRRLVGEAVTMHRVSSPKPIAAPA